MLCAAQTALLPTDTDVSFEWRMYGTRELGGYGYYPIEAPGLTVKEVTGRPRATTGTARSSQRRRSPSETPQSS